MHCELWQTIYYNRLEKKTKKLALVPPLTEKTCTISTRYEFVCVASNLTVYGLAGLMQSVGDLLNHATHQRALGCR